LVNRFKILNYTLSGGSTVKRHVLSPVQVNLSRFILGLEGLNEGLEKSRESFNINTKLHKNFILENFVKDKKIWYLRQYFNFFKESDEKSIIIKLYSIFKNSPFFIDFIFTTLCRSYWDFEFQEKTKNLQNSMNYKIYIILLNFINKESFDLKLEYTMIKDQEYFFKKIQDSDVKFYSLNQRKVNFEDLLNEMKEYMKLLLKRKEIKWLLSEEEIKWIGVDKEYLEKNIKFVEMERENIKNKDNNNKKGLL
jgi:hypothetical protein